MGLVDSIGRVHPNLVSDDEWKKRRDLLLNSGIPIKYGCVRKLAEFTGLTGKQIKSTFKRFNISYT